MDSSDASVEHERHSIFVKDDGQPVHFFFHKSVHHGIEKISGQIQAYGGKIVDNEHHADVVLVDEEADIGLIRRRYYSSEKRYRLGIFVEPRGFVKWCVRNGVYEHRAPSRQGMPGRGIGRIRVKFTQDDDEHLAYYLATIFPDADAGGRMGNLHYKELEELKCYHEYRWVERHTWHSWRERYKNNQPWFDQRIAQIVATLEPHIHGHGHDHRSRKYKTLRNKRNYYENEEEDVDELEEEEEEEESEQGTDDGKLNVAQQHDAAARRYNKSKLDHITSEPKGVTKARQEGNATASRQVDVVSRHNHRKRGRSESGSDIRRHGHVLISPSKRARVAPTSPQTAKSAQTSAVERQHGQKPIEDDELRYSSSEVQGDDLFGDYAVPDAEDPNLPASVSNPDDTAPELTQRTLVESPRHNKDSGVSLPQPERINASNLHPPLPSQPVEAGVAATAENGNGGGFAGEKLAGMQRAPKQQFSTAKRDRGAVVDPGPSNDAPYRHTRARSRSVEPLPTATASSKLKSGKARRKGLASVPEDDKGSRSALAPLAALSGQFVSAAAGETFEEEEVVEDMLGSKSTIHESTVPPSQESEIDNDEPSDSDDAETHGVLRQSSHQARGPEKDGGVSDSSDSSVIEEDDDVQKRLDRMSTVSLTRPTQNPGLRLGPQTRRAASRMISLVPPSQPQEPVFPRPDSVTYGRVMRERKLQGHTIPTGSRAATAAKLRKV